MISTTPVDAKPDNRALLVAVDDHPDAGTWTSTVAVEAVFPDLHPGIVRSRLRKLMRRGLLSGCDCGCRGDWELTGPGREFLTRT